MTATLKQIDPTQVELEINISASEYEAAREQAFRRLSKSAKVPGFRPGKVPRRIFEAQYGTAMIDERAMEDVVPQAYSKAVQEHDLEPVERPHMELMPLEDAGQGLRVKATVAVRPPIELRDYKGLPVTDDAPPVDDDDVERSLEALRREGATLVPVERPLQLGDTAVIDYEGKIDGVPFEGGAATGEETEISENRFIPGFASGMVGMTSGETREVTAHFPEQYGKEELAGKDAVFTITVHDIKEPELPPLDDEFAKRVSRAENVEALRADVRSRLEDLRRQKSRRALSSQILERLLEGYDFPLPEVMVERESESLLQDSKGYVARFGRSWDDFLTETGKTEESLQAEYRSEAERRVRSTLVIEAIAKAEKIEATEDDVERELLALARQYQVPVEQIVEMTRPNMGALIDGIVRTKTVDFLLDNASIEHVAPAAATNAPADESTET